MDWILRNKRLPATESICRCARPLTPAPIAEAVLGSVSGHGAGGAHGDAGGVPAQGIGEPTESLGKRRGGGTHLAFGRLLNDTFSQIEQLVVAVVVQVFARFVSAIDVVYGIAGRHHFGLIAHQGTQ